MIVFYGQGGLGNQLFQYAAARRLAIKHNCQVVLDPYWFAHPRAGETHRPYELDKYPVTLRVANLSEQRSWKWMRVRLSKFLRLLLPLTLVREQGIGVYKPALYASINSYLIGFWQSEAYFADAKKQLISELTPLSPPSATDHSVIEQIYASNSVSIHVRRGDYVSLPSASAFHGLCSLDYYRTAIQYIAERVSGPMFFVFSDDPVWVRENLVIPFPVRYVDHNQPVDAFQDLRMMSLCQHQIIANSSFSWWGAWLGETQNSIIIAPARWYAINRPIPDLIPTRWTRIAA